MSGIVEVPGFLQSPDPFRQSFIDGLVQTLDENNDLGVFIMVLANAAFHDFDNNTLNGKLEGKWRSLVARLDDMQDAPVDDVMVFRKLLESEPDVWRARLLRNVGPWRLQYIWLRSLRPPRSSKMAVTSLQQPFDPAGFHFNKPFLAREVWWQGELLGRDCHLLYNKFPFADYHGLLVVDPQQNYPQFLTRDIHELVWNLAESIGHGLPGIGFGYNAYGAAASVNHLHIQMYMREDTGYPVENPLWRHNGGTDSYPLNCVRVNSCQEAWQHIDGLQGENTAYNLLYRPGMVYILPRRFQGTFALADWMIGMGWSDMAGEIAVMDKGVFEQVHREQVEEQLFRAVPDGDELSVEKREHVR